MGTNTRTARLAGMAVLRGLVALVRRGRPGARVVILGSAPEVAGLALRHRHDPGGVLVVGPAADLAASGVTVRARLGTPQLTRALTTAETVIVAGGDDDESTLLARAVAQAAGTAPFPSVALFDEPAAARAWERQGLHAVSRVEALALAALRAVPPWPCDRATPPPVVIGDTPLATEITRRIAVGWQQPGEPHDIHRVVRDRAGAAPLPPPARGEPDEATDPESVVRVIALRRAAWPEPPATHASVDGPSIYVAGGDDPHALGVLLADRIADARVCVVADVVAPADPRLVVVSPREHLADDCVLLLTPEHLLAEEVFAEAAHWPADVPSLFGVPERDAAGRVLPLAAQPIAARRGVATVASLADDLLRDLGVLLDAAPDAAADVPQITLTPAELGLIADRLVAATPAPVGVDETEHRQRAIEIAARLPTLLARAGRRPRRAPGHPDLLAGLPEWAANVHAQYRLTAQRTGAAGHPNADRRWEDLHPFEQQSNRAQLADIPAKLAAVGLDCRPATDPETPLFVFTDEVLDRLAPLEHRRWEQFQRRNGRPGHRLAVPWDALGTPVKDLNRDAVREIPQLLRFVGLDIIDPHAAAVAAPEGTATAERRCRRVR